MSLSLQRNISQKNVAEVKMDTWSVTKRNVLISVQRLKIAYIRAEPEINEIAKDIQHKMNQANLQPKDIQDYALKLKKKGIPIDGAEKIISDLIFLAKHNNKDRSATKTNWFGITNKTNSIKQFINFKLEPGHCLRGSSYEEKIIHHEHIATVKSNLATIYRNPRYHIDASVIYKNIYNGLMRLDTNRVKLYDGLGKVFDSMHKEELEKAKEIYDDIDEAKEGIYKDKYAPIDRPPEIPKYEKRQ